MPTTVLDSPGSVKYLGHMDLGRASQLQSAASHVDYDLRAYLTDCRERGYSYRWIARTLREDGISASHETIRAWCAELSSSPA